MNPHRSLFGPILVIGVYFLCAAQLRAILPYLDPAAPGTTFTITDMSGTYWSVGATSNDLVALQPNEVVEIDAQLWVPTGQCPDSGPTVTIEPLDGGAVVNGSTTVVADGCGGMSFDFQAPANAGVSQVKLRVNGQDIGIQFFVIDPADPTNHPPTIN
jgi:hypothetical protein